MICMRMKHRTTRHPQLAEKLEPMPEVSDHYMGAEILLPRGDEMARGHAVAWSGDAKGNVIGRAHMYPILDTMMCQIEFAGSKKEWQYLMGRCNIQGNRECQSGI